MGQVTSVATPHANVLPFVNLPKEAILSIWLSYNLLGEGWALTLDQFASIFKEANFVQSHYNFSDDQISKLFVTLDTDANGLIDALETFVTIGLLSGMIISLSFAAHYSSRADSFFFFYLLHVFVVLPVGASLSLTLSFVRKIK